MPVSAAAQSRSRSRADVDTEEEAEGQMWEDEDEDEVHADSWEEEEEKEEKEDEEDEEDEENEENEEEDGTGQWFSRSQIPKRRRGRSPQRGGRRERRWLQLDSLCRACHDTKCAHTCDPVARKAAVEAIKREAIERIFESEAMTTDEAERTAAVEGLTLVRASPAYGCIQPSSTCFYGVQAIRMEKGALRPFAVDFRVGKRTIYLGRFVSKAAAALEVARYLGPNKSRELDAKIERRELCLEAQKQPPMSEEAAQRTAKAEGLILVRASANATGFRGVNRVSASSYSVSKWTKGGKEGRQRRAHLGC